MTPQSFTDRQQQHARLAQALRELASDVPDIKLADIPSGDDPPVMIPAIWPAENISETLHRAADLIDEMTLKLGANA